MSEAEAFPIVPRPFTFQDVEGRSSMASGIAVMSRLPSAVATGGCN